MPPLSWRHHTLIQALLSRGPLKEDDFRSIFSQVSGRSSGSQQQQLQQLFNEFLRKINAELCCVQLELRACRNQYDGNVHYGVVNNVSDDQSKLGTKYTVPQIAFYKGIVEAIIQDPEAGGCIFSTDALNVRLETQVTDSQSQVQIPPAFKNFSMSQKEKTLGQLVKDQWLCSIPDGKIGIGLRSFLDLRSWFRTNEVPVCDVCNEAAVKAQVCENEACNVRLHLYCLKKKFSGQRVERVCPGCGTKWPGSTVKAEAVEKANAESSMKRRRNADMAASDSMVKAEAVEKANAESSTKSRRNADMAASDSTVKAEVVERANAETSMKRRRNADMAASDSDTRRVTRRSARLTGN